MQQKGRERLPRRIRLPVEARCKLREAEADRSEMQVDKIEGKTYCFCTSMPIDTGQAAVLLVDGFQGGNIRSSFIPICLRKREQDLNCARLVINLRARLPEVLARVSAHQRQRSPHWQDLKVGRRLNKEQRLDSK